MKVQLMTDPFHSLLIEDLYDPDELNVIWDEIEYLRPHFVDGDEATYSAEVDGQSIKRNKGILLDRHFKDNRDESDILKINRKPFILLDQIESGSWFFDKFSCNLDYTLLSYYENSDHYKKHRDSASITCLTWFFREPQKFRGGELVFPDYDVTLPVKNNGCVMFPSKIYHAVNAVEMDEEDLGKGLGRHTMTQFMNCVTEMPV
ncbi:hypothetical protein RW110999_032 [Cyanophage S-RIM4]|nr:hypothetical protein RW110999_032 [Cyanophage S-RIM4]